VSHLKERKEKNCLNCNAEVLGRYCHVCGQENVEIKESFWHLVTHLVYDIMHFDSKFFDTLKYLLLKPGFLTKEYLRGRRSSYLHPVRMYVFASAIFFIIFFSFIIKPSEIENNAKTNEKKTTLTEQIQLMQDSLKKTADPEKRKELENTIEGLKMASAYMPSAIVKGSKDDINIEEEDSSASTKTKNQNVFNLRDSMPSTIREYDSLQTKLPERDRDNWLMRIAMHRSITINEKYKGDSERFKEDFEEKFKHSVPQMMFVSLPLIALIMQLLYIRRRKQFFYVDHAIFIIHVYIAIFISLLIYYGFDGLQLATGFRLFGWIRTLIGFYIFLYCLVAMYKFYGQGIVKTTFKYFILLFIASILTGLLMGIFVITSFFQI
jgi:hypothetical protein